MHLQQQQLYLVKTSSAKVMIETIVFDLQFTIKIFSFIRFVVVVV